MPPIDLSGATPEEVKAHEEAEAAAIAANPQLQELKKQADKEAEEESIRLGFSTRDPVSGKLIPKSNTKEAVIKGLKIGVIGLGAAALVTLAVKKWG